MAATPCPVVIRGAATMVGESAAVKGTVAKVRPEGRPGRARHRRETSRGRQPSPALHTKGQVIGALVRTMPTGTHRGWLVYFIRDTDLIMNAAAKTSCHVIEKSLGKSQAFKKVDEGLYVVKQGSSIVMINVLAWNTDRAVVRCVAQLVKGVSMEVPLALQLLEMNALLRFGAFAYVPAGGRDHLLAHAARR